MKAPCFVNFYSREAHFPKGRGIGKKEIILFKFPPFEQAGMSTTRNEQVPDIS
jgi:hypothetical protein